MTQAEKTDKFADEIYNAGMDARPTYEIENLDPFKPYIYAFQSVCADKFVKITPSGQDPFYAYFQPCYNKVAPLAVHTPGYGGEMSIHPEVAQYYHVLHICPLGYSTPSGKDTKKLTMNGVGTVLPDTAITCASGGYRTWLTQCVMAIKWAFDRDDVIKRIAFFGTSQGGGASLLLGSIFSGRGTACVCADQPFMTNFPLAAERGAYGMGKELIANLPKEQVENAYALIDTVNHVHRYRFPVLLTSGGQDAACPADTVLSLFNLLTHTKSYTHFEHLPHGYNREFVSMALAWMRIFA